MRILICFALICGLAACKEEEQASTETPVRGLKTHLVQSSEESTVRRFPSILEPTSVNALSFDIGGKLTEVSLQVGQRVGEGDELAAIDPEALDTQIASAEAGVRSATAAHESAAETLRRQEELFQRGSTTKVALETAQTDVRTRQAQLEQAQSSLEAALNNRDKSVLRAPFDGIVNSVEVQSFATIAAGAPIVSIYSPEVFELSFSANFDTVNQLVVGTPATVRLADRPDIPLKAMVSELGSRADTVSSFPVVLTLAETDPILKAGMAAEIAIELPLPAAEGFVLPLSAIIKEGTINGGNNAPPGKAQVYVFDEASSTVVRRDIVLAGVRENALLVIEGLAPGDRVASAGVSFLRDGQEVKLLSDGE